MIFMASRPFAPAAKSISELAVNLLLFTKKELLWIKISPFWQYTGSLYLLGKPLLLFKTGLV